MKRTKSALARIALVLASATAISAAPGAALAHGSGGGHSGVSHQMSAPQPSRSGNVAMGMRSRTMTSKPTAYRQNSAYVHRKHKGCGKLIVPTAGCATPARDPVGHTTPSLPKEAKQPVGTTRKPVLESFKKPGPQSATQPTKAPAQPTATPAGVAAPAKPVSVVSAITVSNGVNSSPLAVGKGITVSNVNGTLTVSNGQQSVTLPGGSLTLKNVPALTAAPGVQVVPLGNGMYSVAANAAPSAPKPVDTSAVPPGVGIKDDLKFVGGQLVASPLTGSILAVGAVSTPIVASVAAVTGGSPVKTAKEWLGAAADSAGFVAKGITDLF